MTAQRSHEHPWPKSLHHRVTLAAKRQLGLSQYLPLRRVSCVFDRGVLVLRGELPSFYHKQLAQETVASLAGVNQVINEIEVVRQPGHGHGSRHG